MSAIAHIQRAARAGNIARLFRYRIQPEREAAGTHFVVYRCEPRGAGGEAPQPRRVRIESFSTFELARQAYPDAIPAFWDLELE